MLKLIFMNESLVVWQPEDISEALPLLKQEDLISITKMHGEISVVCKEEALPDNPSGKIEHNWRYFKVDGVLDFSLVGILSSIVSPLADAGVSVFAISTYDTDYVLIKQDDVEKSKQALIDKFTIV